MSIAWLKNATVYGEEYWFIGFLIGILIFIITWRMNKKKLLRIMLLYVYLLILFGYTVFCRAYWAETSYKFNIFWSYIEALKGNREALLSIELNVLIFIPVGFGIAALLKSKSNAMKVINVLLWALGISFLIEELQMLRHIGYFELDDLVNNTIGGGLGCCLHGLLKRFYQRRDNKI